MTFTYHMITLKLLQDMLARFRDRLAWIFTNYFTAEAQAGLNLWPEPKPFQSPRSGLNPPAEGLPCLKLAGRSSGARRPRIVK